jgi:hypothetical protein
VTPSTPQGFDPSRSRFPVRTVAIQEVVDLLDGGAADPRVVHAPEVVERYRRAMDAGDRFPPVSVVRMAGRLLLADGHKRLRAYRSFAPATVPVEIWPLWRWAADQAEQLRRNAGKNARIVGRSFRDPKGAWRLLATTLAHWRRVALSLSGRRASRR